MKNGHLSVKASCLNLDSRNRYWDRDLNTGLLEEYPFPYCLNYGEMVFMVLHRKGHLMHCTAWGYDIIEKLHLHLGRYQRFLKAGGYQLTSASS